MRRKVVNIVQETRIYNNNSGTFVFPLLVNRKILNSINVIVNFFDSITDKVYDCDVLVITSKFAREKRWWDKKHKNEMFEFLLKAKSRTNALIWADLSDGTGTTHFEILPYVDRYLKAFILRDKDIYQTFLYGSRYNTDYYHRKYGIKDDNPGEPHLNYKPSTEDLNKLRVSWHQAFYSHSYLGYNYMKIKQYLAFLPDFYIVYFTPPFKERKSLLTCRININYGRNTISFHRQKIKKLLNGKVACNKISRKQYFNELRNSRVAVSPFGWGETSYRDYDIIISGATLIKPDCDHMETWPNFYEKNKTYLSFKWDFSDFNNIIESLSERKEELIEIAMEAQERYRYYLFSNKGENEFCERFKTLVSFR